MVDVRLKKPFRPEIRIVGEERTPVVVIDEPILDPEALISYATSQASFGADDRFAYPGMRTGLPKEYAETLLPRLLELISDVYKIPTSSEHHLVHELFSLVTKAPEELAPLQRVPHFDNHNPYYFATVHYLSPGTFAGTGIFRHRPTRYERISEDRFPSYVQAAESHFRAHGLPAAKYINASDDHYELIADIEYRPNRLVMYPGNLLHSGLIRPDRDISDDPASGRLTANLFLYFK